MENEELKDEAPKPITLKCKFCGEPTGEYMPPRPYQGLQLDPKQFGIIDSRCTPCEEIHGKYSE